MPRLTLADLSFVRRFAALVGWRGLAGAVVFACGLAAFVMGVEVSDRVGVGTAMVAVKIYYTIGLFVLGGMDLGMPSGGPLAAQVLLWIAYFAAPALTASAVVDGLFHILRPDAWKLRRLRGHVVVGGCGRLAMLYLKRLREVDRFRPVVVVERQADHPHAGLARDLYRAQVLTGSIASETVLRGLNLEHASRVVLLTGDDFVNLDSASRILEIAPAVGGRTVVHVGNLHFMRVMANTRVAKVCDVFNIHHIAARHLVETQLLGHFRQTSALDVVVFAGFGRFGQTVLDVLQREAERRFDTVVVVDNEAEARGLDFQEQVGFLDWYERHLVDGDLRDRRLWRRIEPVFTRRGREAVFVVGSGDDGTNIHTALWLGQRFPKARIIARSFRRSFFAEEVSRQGGFHAFSVADLVARAMPRRWLLPARADTGERGGGHAQEELAPPVDDAVASSGVGRESSP